MSIKDFTILSELGKGAYSCVYKVQRTHDKEFYALKKVKLLNLSEKQLQNALNEVRILASIHHPNIVTYKDAFLEGKNLCIVMDYMDNGDLYQAVTEKKKKKTPFEEKQIWRVLIQSVRGLRKLHGMKILHRDMKSANIFLSKKGEAKLGDLNVSKIAKEGLLYTQTGTPYYASPQVWNEKPYDAKSDIWSLGVVMYEMTALEVPFQAEDMEGLANSIVKGKYTPLPSDYSDELCRIISLMLEVNPSKRPSAEKICKSSLFKKRCKEVGLQEFSDPETDEMLQTIRIPKKIENLTDRLPNSNYDAIQRRELSRSASYKKSTIIDRVHSHQSMNKANFPKIDKLLKYHEQKINDQRRRVYDRSSIQVVNHVNHANHANQANHVILSNQANHANRKSIQNLQAHSYENIDVRKPPLNRKQMLQKDLKRIRQGKHQVHGIRHYY